MSVCIQYIIVSFKLSKFTKKDLQPSFEIFNQDHGQFYDCNLQVGSEGRCLTIA